jgi:hypothetical protein
MPRQIKVSAESRKDKFSEDVCPDVDTAPAANGSWVRLIWIKASPPRRLVDASAGRPAMLEASIRTEGDLLVLLPPAAPVRQRSAAPQPAHAAA